MLGMAASNNHKHSSNSKGRKEINVCGKWNNSVGRLAAVRKIVCTTGWFAALLVQHDAGTERQDDERAHHDADRRYPDAGVEVFRIDHDAADQIWNKRRAEQFYSMFYGIYGKAPMAGVMLLAATGGECESLPFSSMRGWVVARMVTISPAPS